MAAKSLERKFFLERIFVRSFRTLSSDRSIDSYKASPPQIAT